VTSVSIDVSAVPSRPAGAGRYVLEVARRVAERGDLDVALLARHGDTERWQALAPRSRVLGVAPDRRPARLAWGQAALGRVLSTAGPQSGPVDVHHAPHYSMPWRCPVPAVVTIHDLTFLDHPEWHERSKVLFFRHAIRHAARNADALVCVSEATKDRLVELLHPACPVHVVPHGVDVDTFSPVEPSAGVDRAALEQLSVREPYVLHLGTIEPRKDVPSLLRAFDEVAERRPGLTLVLAGTPGWGSEDAEAAMREMRHGERVQRLGYVEGELLPSLLRRARAVAYPSREEGFGLPALEALACGAPLVTTVGTAMAALAGEAALLVPPGDPEKLAGALEAILDGDRPAALRRERGIALAATHSWIRSADEHARIYAAVAASAGSPRRRPGRGDR
jgi:glycosyltransferase involved in cell wall biosynthesis